MKPDKAKQLSVDADLGVRWAYNAEEIIRKTLNPETGYENKILLTVKINKTEMPAVFALAYFMKYEIEADESYDVDEWSLLGWYYKDTGEGVECLSCEVWSPGA